MVASKTKLISTLGAVCLSGSLLLPACNSAKVAEPLTGKYSGNEPETQMEFWHDLAERPVTSNDEAFHGVLLYIDQNDPAKDYEGRVEALKARKLLPSDFGKPAGEAVSRGTLAIILVQMLDIKGGLTMRVFGPSERYATRELMYMNLYPASSPHQTFSGSEFLGIIGRIEDYQRVNPAKAPAAMLPGEIEAQDKNKDTDAAATSRPGSASPADSTPPTEQTEH